MKVPRRLRGAPSSCGTHSDAINPVWAEGEKTGVTLRMEKIANGKMGKM